VTISSPSISPSPIPHNILYNKDLEVTHTIEISRNTRSEQSAGSYG
jgi:hypothetical protein